VQFFPLLNYQIYPLILAKAEFNCKVSTFFRNYLIKRKTKYIWNNFSFPFCNVDVGATQGSVFSPILSVLYLSPLFYILEKQLKNLKIPISILSFVDNSLFISQHKSISVLNENFFCSYNANIEKLKYFIFFRSHGILNPSSLNLTPFRGGVLFPKPT